VPRFDDPERKKGGRQNVGRELIFEPPHIPTQLGGLQKGSAGYGARYVRRQMDDLACNWRGSMLDMDTLSDGPRTIGYGYNAPLSGQA